GLSEGWGPFRQTAPSPVSASDGPSVYDGDDGTPVRDPVSLNVGGQVYTTTLDTLTRYRDSMLGAMFTGQIPALRDRRGNVFIDRDGNVFRHILNFLRSGALDLPRGFKELALLRREADFFQIRPLVEELAHLEAAGPLSLRGGDRVPEPPKLYQVSPKPT
uniref:Potassium channel tetramerization domain containing 21 n=1 Tax=Salarias fasciatus TaxID=181472 RepID=A0A672GX77_SALFA